MRRHPSGRRRQVKGILTPRLNGSPNLRIRGGGGRAPCGHEQSAWGSEGSGDESPGGFGGPGAAGCRASPPPTSHRMRHQCLCYSVASKVSLLLGVELQEHGWHPSVTPEAPEPGTWSTALERASWSLPWAPLREVVVLATGLRRAGLCPKAPGADGIFCGSNKQKGHRWVRRPVCHLLQTLFKARTCGPEGNVCLRLCLKEGGRGWSQEPPSETDLRGPTREAVRGDPREVRRAQHPCILAAAQEAAPVRPPRGARLQGGSRLRAAARTCFAFVLGFKFLSVFSFQLYFIPLVISN